MSRTEANDCVPVTGTTPSANALFTRVDGNTVHDPANPDRYFTIGGRDAALPPPSPTSLGSAEGLAQVYDREFRVNGPAAPWLQGLPSLNTRRAYCDTVVLPDRSLLVLHGSMDQYGPGGLLSFPAQAASKPERIVLNPVQGWEEMAEESHLRAYHATGLLLPDTRVASMGGQFGQLITGLSFQSDAQIFNPPYRFQGPAPAIASPITQIQYGAAVPLVVNLPASDSVGSVVLIRSGSVTHGVEFDQRVVPLAIQSVSPPTPLPGGWNSVTCTVVGPAADPGITPVASHQAPPGYYMLFVVTAPTANAPQGIPSRALFVRVQ